MSRALYNGGRRVELFFVALPLGLLLIVLVRFGWRRWLYRQRYTGRFLFRTVVVGSGTAAEGLSEKLDEEAYVGYQVCTRVASPPTGPALLGPRMGSAGSTFTMLKFRSTRANADEDREIPRLQHGHDDPMFKLTEDSRITGVGRVLRLWWLDKLPQLFNVFAGSMSLVRPRPHPMDDVNRYGTEAFRRLALKPGMTGLWQVEGRFLLTWTEALQLDLYYDERWSLKADLVLLARTLRAVIQGRGAH